MKDGLEQPSIVLIFDDFRGKMLEGTCYDQLFAAISIQ